MHQPHRLAVAILAALSSSVAVAQSAPTDKPDVLEQIVVTGTRATDRTVGESVSPIDIITPEILGATVTTELATERTTGTTTFSTLTNNRDRTNKRDQQPGQPLSQQSPTTA